MKAAWSSFMDRRVKERLVGATILGLLVVLIVPELLSGPKRAIEAPQASLAAATEPIRSVTVDLATSKATAANDDAAASSAAVEDASASGSPPDTDAQGAAVPAMATPDAAPTAAPASAATPVPAATPAHAVTPVQAEQAPPPQPDTPHHGWQAQLGSFSARANAERLERQLEAQGFSPSMSATGAGPALRYRVRVGPVPDRAAAERLLAKLEKAGHSATLVAP